MAYERVSSFKVGVNEKISPKKVYLFNIGYVYRIKAQVLVSRVCLE